MIFNRHNLINEVKEYWDNDKESNIGLGRLKRNNDFTVTKTYGREDICLINYTDGNQYCFEPYGFSRNTPEEVKEIMLQEICPNIEQVLRSLHFINWFNQQTIVNMPVKDCISLLQKGLDSFSFVEAMKLFPIK